MGDANTVLTEPQAIHLLRRGGFGFRRRDVDRILSRGETRGEAVDRLMAPPPARFKPGGSDIVRVRDRWIKYMLRSPRVFQEKMAVFLHDHFATSNDTVEDPRQMAKQNQLFRLSYKGSFKDLVKAVNKDPAMMEFLDTVRNRRAQPNENYGRELLELFTLGVLDLNGNENYAQEDIVQIARAFTGWRIDDSDRAFLRTSQHDYMEDYSERGPKVIFENHGNFSGGADFAPLIDVGGGVIKPDEGENEIDRVIDIIFDHTHFDPGDPATPHNTVARHLTYKLLNYYAYVDSDLANRKAVIDEIIAGANFTTTWSLGSLLREIFVHDVFYETMAPAPFGASTPKSVKWPIDYVVGTLRTLNMRLRGRDNYVSGGDYNFARDILEAMGQVLFAPPSVFGWDWEASWVNSGSLLSRYTFARDITSARKRPHGDAGGRAAFRPEKLLNDTIGSSVPAAQIVDDALDVLSVGDQFTTAEKNILIDYVGDGNPSALLDLTDEDVVLLKLHGLFALIVQSASFQLH